MSDKTMEKTVHKALKSVAKREGVSVESVRHEIELAVAAARENDDPEIQMFWNSIPTKNNNSLTAEDVIAYFARMELDREE